MRRYIPVLLSLLIIILAIQAVSTIPVEAQLPDGGSTAALALETLQEAPLTDDDTQGSGLIWSLFISIMVIAACGSVVYLCYHAMQAWSGHWKLMALAPLIVLLVWVLLISVSKLLNSASHSLWPFELFAWAMIATTYLVILMTAKRAFIKADEGDT